LSKLPVVSGADCVKALGKVGFVVFRQRGCHITMVRRSPPAQTTIPNHKELDRGTLRAIIRQAGVTVEELSQSCDPAGALSGPAVIRTAELEKGSLMIRHIMSLALTISFVVVAHASDENRRTIIYDGISTEIAAAADSSSDLWISTADLARATRFAIKPQGVCRDELCFPLPKNRMAEFVSKKGATTWFNLSEFARLIKQSFIVDQKNSVWYFGAREAEQNSYLSSLEAPNFTLPDLNGKLHSLADFRGQKVLLVTWASW